LSSGSLPRNSFSDLRPIPIAAQYDSSSPASNLIRVLARTLVLRLALLQRELPRPSRHSDAPRPGASHYENPPKPQRSHRKDSPGIIPARSTTYKSHRPEDAASFKSLYLMRPLHTTGKTAPLLVGASDTALRLPVPNRGRPASDYFRVATIPG
jgi:hypothetical protein